MRLLLILVALGSNVVAQAIEWQGSYTAALEKARAADKPILIAVNMDDERACERLVRDYKDPAVVAATADYVCLIASRGFHADEPAAPCPRFPGVTCVQHRQIEQEMRERLLGVEGPVTAPQHLVLTKEGAIHRTKLWYLTKDELRSFLATNLAELYPKTPPEVPKDAPKVPGGEKPAEAPKEKGTEDPATPAEWHAAILATEDTEEVRRWGRELVKTDSEESRALLEELFARDDLGPRLLGLVLAHGFKGHVAGVKFLVPYLKDKDADVRAHAAVALEDIADKSALKHLMKHVKSEEDEKVRKNIVRALGSSGAGDRRVAEILVKLTRDKDGAIRRNAAVALSHFPKNNSVEKALMQMAFIGGGRDAWRKMGEADAAAYSLAAVGSGKALEEAEKRLERETNERTAGIYEQFVVALRSDFDPTSRDAILWRVRAAQDDIRRDGDPLDIPRGGGGMGGGPGDGPGGPRRPGGRDRPGGDQGGQD